MRKKSKRWWGFDSKSIDKRVRPQDDFYAYANGVWMQKNKIPPDESRWGSFNTLRFTTEIQLKKLLDSTQRGLVADIYASASDMKRYRREK